MIWVANLNVRNNDTDAYFAAHCDECATHADEF